MPGIFARVHINSVLGLVSLLVLWFLLFEFTHILIMLLRREPLIGWAIGPFGFTILGLHQPSLLYLWLDVLGPACVSGSVLYLGLFTPLSPLALPDNLFFQLVTITAGILFSSTGDFINAMRDLRYPLWGEARVLRSIQNLRSCWARIHFTSFGLSFMYDRFGSHPTDLLQAL